MNAEGKREYIVFSILGCGTESETTKILDWARQTSSVPNNEGNYDPETVTAVLSAKKRKGSRVYRDANKV
jgi:hypothetical protein